MASCRWRGGVGQQLPVGEWVLKSEILKMARHSKNVGVAFRLGLFGADRSIPMCHTISLLVWWTVDGFSTHTS